jgi:DNA-binding transcriptional LysR family regulator
VASSDLEPDLTFSEMRAFIAVTETGTSTAAALRLGITQPAVSRQLKRLEEKLGIILFDRSFQRLRLTAAGRQFEAYARGALAAFEGTITALRHDSGLLEGELRVAASTTPGDYVVPRWLEQFVALHPALRPQVSISDSASVVQDILDRNWDVGFIGEEPANPALVKTPIAEDEVVLAVRAEHRFAAQAEIDVSELEGEPFIGRERGSATVKTVEEGLRARGLALPGYRVVMTLNTTQASLLAVQRGIGHSWASIRGLEQGLIAGVVPVRLRGLRFKRNLYMIHARRGVPPVAAAFIQWLLTAGARQ